MLVKDFKKRKSNEIIEDDIDDDDDDFDKENADDFSIQA